jgi:UDP-N-acetylglucosamine 2-epimerase (non-hydrolysing)
MPEELNRVVTDHLSDLLFATEPAALLNLRREGIPDERVHLVGNVMIDTLEKHRARAARSDVLARLELAERAYAVCTLHRPSNVDDPLVLERILAALDEIAAEVPIVFPVHPRTRARLAETAIGRRIGAGASAPLPAPSAAGVGEQGRRGGGWRLTEPLGYVDFLRLMDRAALVLTDSGGIQEETTALGVPCVTLRENTERPITVEEGTNVLAGCDPASIVRHARAALAGGARAGGRPSLWDGHAARRIALVLEAATEERWRSPA